MYQINLDIKYSQLNMLNFDVNYNMLESGADLGNFPGGGVIFHQTPKWYEKAREARENFFLPPPWERISPPLDVKLGGGSGGGKLFE